VDEGNAGRDDVEVVVEVDDALARELHGHDLAVDAVAGQGDLEGSCSFGGGFLAEPDQDGPVVEHDVSAFDGARRELSTVRHPGCEPGKGVGFGKTVCGIQAGGEEDPVDNEGDVAWEMLGCRRVFPGRR
jgi:hypothetical protein